MLSGVDFPEIGPKLWPTLESVGEGTEFDNETSSGGIASVTTGS